MTINYSSYGGIQKLHEQKGVVISNEFELEFSSSSRAMKVPSRAGAL